MAVFNLFEVSLAAKCPLAVPERLANPELNLPISFIYGELDWMYKIDGEGSETILAKNKFKSSRVQMIPESNHSPHLENEEATVNAILNDLCADWSGFK